MSDYILISNYAKGSVAQDKQRMNASHYLFLLFWLLKPFYFWQSGSMQVSDYVFVVSFLVWVIINRGNILIDDKNLYFSSGNIDKILYQMDLKKDKISKLKLKEINPQQILPYKNKLFVTHCDLTSGMGKAISLLNPQTGESKVYKFKHNVIQCQTKEDYLYILSNDSIYKYKFDGEKMHLEASSKISFKGSWKDGYISSFFLK